MDQITPSLSALLDLFSPCFRFEVAATFRLMVVAWIVCLGRRTISRVWETTGRSADGSPYPAFRLFSAAVWNWDEVCRILMAQLLAALVPGTRVWLVIDDTLCHKRGARVAFGGIFLDAVLSSKRHKAFRFGTNWVTLGLIVELPFRQDRFFCVNVLWRLYAKKDKDNPAGHRTKPQLALGMVLVVASWLPGRQLLVVGDRAYIGKHLLKGLPAEVAALGPIHWKAELTEPLPGGPCGRRKKGDKLTTPKQAMADDRWPWEDLLLRHPKGEKELRVKVVRPCCWSNSAGRRLLQVVLVRDPDGQWRDEALLCSDLDLSAQEVVLGYLRRWSVEPAYCDAKQLLGFH
ncbi:MAG TPA: transposase, partial [Gemmataceae bacterium]|nr:transposase [Gemmataceae bacterium]